MIYLNTYRWLNEFAHLLLTNLDKLSSLWQKLGKSLKRSFGLGNVYLRVLNLSGSPLRPRVVKVYGINVYCCMVLHGDLLKWGYIRDVINVLMTFLIIGPDVLILGIFLISVAN